MEALANKLASKISLQFGYDQSRKSVISYGLIAIFQMVSILFSVLLIGLFLGFWQECLVLYAFVGILRKSTGGAHASSMENCLVISVISISLLSYLAKIVSLNFFSMPDLLIISAFLFAVYFFIAYKKVPVDTPNKPITKPEKIFRLRKQCLFTLIIYFIITVFCIFFSQYYSEFLSIALAIHFSILWQILTLTKPGAVVLNAADKGLTYLFRRNSPLT